METMGTSRYLMVGLALLVNCAGGTRQSVSSQADVQVRHLKSADNADFDQKSVACADKAMVCWAKRSDSKSTRAEAIRTELVKSESQVTVAYDQYPNDELFDKRAACADKPIVCHPHRDIKSSIGTNMTESAENEELGAEGRIACADKPVLCSRR